MENHGIKYYCFAGPEDIAGHSPPGHRKLKHRALIIREKIIGMYKERGITGDRLALVAAITLGQKNLLDPEQKQDFIKAGSHAYNGSFGFTCSYPQHVCIQPAFFPEREAQYSQDSHNYSFPLVICVCDRI